MKKKSLAQVRIYQRDRDRVAVIAKKSRTTIADIIHAILISVKV